MAYRYNEKTGEFEDVPKTASSTKNSSSDEGGARDSFTRIMSRLITLLISSVILAVLSSLCS